MRTAKAGNVKPLAGIQEATSAEPVNTRMSWDEVKPRLQWQQRREYPIAPSPAYADAFRNGATLFPQSLVVFEQPQSRARGIVYFQTNQAKGKWSRTESERTGSVEERFVKPALFSRLLLPFGTIGNSHVIAPFRPMATASLPGLSAGDDAARFRPFWDNMDRQWREHVQWPPAGLRCLTRIDLFWQFFSATSAERWQSSNGSIATIGSLCYRRASSAVT